MTDQHPRNPHLPREPSRLDRPHGARAALARSLDRLLAGTAMLPATPTAGRRLARVAGPGTDDRAWRDGEQHARATRGRTRSAEAHAFLDAAQASVRLRADLLIDPNERP